MRDLTITELQANSAKESTELLCEHVEGVSNKYSQLFDYIAQVAAGVAICEQAFQDDSARVKAVSLACLIAAGAISLLEIAEQNDKLGALFNEPKTSNT